MRRQRVLLGATGLTMALALAVPAAALADGATDRLGFTGRLAQGVGINTEWVLIAGILVFLMQAGFLMLEVGFSRGKNAGTVVAKILTNMAVCALCFWAVGFAIAFGAGNGLFGHHGFFLAGHGVSREIPLAYPTAETGVTAETLWFFELTFAMVALAIVWGTTLERLKFGVYIIFGVLFSSVIYPVVAHWIFGGGWLASELHVQDFAGSIVVDVTAATAALAVLLLLGPRKGKYDAEGVAHAIPGHNMPLFGLGVLILWVGWYGFNPGSTLSALDGRIGTIALVTTLAGSAGILAALATMWRETHTIDIGMAGNGAIAGLVAITGPAGYVEPWAAPVIGAVAGVIVVVAVIAIDRHLDDPVGALAAHGVCGAWGAISLGLFAAPRLAERYLPGSHGGLFYTGSLQQLGSQAAGVVIVFAFTFTVSFAAFWVIRKTYGLRVTQRQEDLGIDISEHGMYGYPEQFIPSAELYGYGGGEHRTVPPAPVPAPET